MKSALQILALLSPFVVQHAVSVPAPQQSEVPFEQPIPAITDQMKADICGRFRGDSVPADTRNLENWKKYNIDQWIRDTLKVYQSRDWKLTPESSTPAADLQSILLHAAGPEGGSKCPSLLGDCDLNLDYNLCIQNPFAHFALWAVESFHNYLKQVSDVFGNSHQLILGFTGQIKGEFFTPLKDPTKLIVPISILGGIMAMFTSVAPWAKYMALPAAAAGTASIVNGIATQDALEIPQPLDQWEQVQTAITTLWEGVAKAMDEYQKKQLRSPLPPPGEGTDYVEDKVQAPWIWKEGRFATPWVLGPFENNIVGAMASSAINALWVADGNMIIRITDKVWNKASGGSVCDLYPKVTVCKDGVAYLVVRWRKNEATIGNPASGDYPLDPRYWWAWGAYDEGTGAEGAKNANNLKIYGDLTLEKVVTSSENTQKNHGFLYSNQNENTLQSIQDHPENLTPDNILEWNLPVCDLEEILNSWGYSKIKRGKKPTRVTDPPGGDDDSPLWRSAVPCTCFRAKSGGGWPKEDYPASQKLGADERHPVECLAWEK